MPENFLSTCINTIVHVSPCEPPSTNPDTTFKQQTASIFQEFGSQQIKKNLLARGKSTGRFGFRMMAENVKRETL